MFAQNFFFPNLFELFFFDTNRVCPIVLCVSNEKMKYDIKQMIVIMLQCTLKQKASFRNRMLIAHNTLAANKSTSKAEMFNKYFFIFVI